VDEVVLTIAPVALGGGPAIFEGEGLAANRFTLQECRPYAANAVRLRWTRPRNPECSHVRESGKWVDGAESLESGEAAIQCHHARAVLHGERG